VTPSRNPGVAFLFMDDPNELPDYEAPIDPQEWDVPLFDAPDTQDDPF
jgi:hypothetical protein